jgi:hypothetical protein
MFGAGAVWIDQFLFFRERIPSPAVVVVASTRTRSRRCGNGNRWSDACRRPCATIPPRQRRDHALVLALAAAVTWVALASPAWAQEGKDVTVPLTVKGFFGGNNTVNLVAIEPELSRRMYEAYTRERRACHLCAAAGHR